MNTAHAGRALMGISVFACLGFAGVEHSATGQSATKGCLPPGRGSDYILSEYRSLMGRTDAIATMMLSIAGVPKVSVNAISVRLDSATCSRAADAYSAALSNPDSNRLVHVVKVGPRFIVVDPALPNPRSVQVTFDTLFSQPPLSVLGK